MDTTATRDERITGLLESYYKVWLRLAHRRTHSQQLAADLVNDAIVIFLEQIRAGKLVELDDRLVGYVFRVSMNLLRNHRRHHGNREDIRASPVELDACIAPEAGDAADEECTRHLVGELLAPLSKCNRELIQRFYLHEEDKDSLSASLEMSMPQINLRIWRARQQMRETCAAKGLSPHDVL